LFVYRPIDGKNCRPLTKENNLSAGNGFRRGRRQTVAMIEHTEARYEVQDVEMGEVYTWRPESVVVECDCGKRPTLTASKTTCGGCGADHKTVAQEWLDVERLGDEAAHPWRYAEDRGDAGLPY
jgi:hypothetical protein